MRPLLFALLAVPLLVALPAIPAHDESQVQWDVACATNAPTTSDLSVLNTRSLPYTPGELALAGDKLLVSRWGSGGYQVFSLANPAAPSPLGSVITSGTALDVKASLDNQNAFVGGVGRIHVTDMSNPNSPVLRQTILLPIGQDQGHMLHVTQIGTKEYLFAASQSGSGVYIFEVTGTTPATRSLLRIGQFAPGSPLAAHDMWVHHDPVLGAPILYVANGFGGWIAADVSNPALPIPLAVVPNADLGQSYLHTVQADWIDGRRIVVTIAELGGNLMRVWDATILTAPVLLASWSSQSSVGIVPSLSSQHNIQIVDGLLYMAHYRCGFWVFDLTALPSVPVPDFLLQPVSHLAVQAANGQHWDIVLRNGYIYTSDMRQGVNSGAFYTVAYTPLTQGNAAHTSSG